MNVRCHDRAIAPELLARCYPLLFGKMHQSIIQAVERTCLNQLFSILNGTVTWDGMIVNPTEPAPLGVTDNLVVRCGITPTHQAARHTNAERHRDRCGRSSIPRGLWRGTNQVIARLQHELRIVQQAIHLNQLGIHFELERNT